MRKSACRDLAGEPRSTPTNQRAPHPNNPTSVCLGNLHKPLLGRLRSPHVPGPGRQLQRNGLDRGPQPRGGPGQRARGGVVHQERGQQLAARDACREPDAGPTRPARGLLEVPEALCLLHGEGLAVLVELEPQRVLVPLAAEHRVDLEHEAAEVELRLADLVAPLVDGAPPHRGDALGVPLQVRQHGEHGGDVCLHVDDHHARAHPACPDLHLDPVPRQQLRLVLRCQLRQVWP
mmetsp:Transcript_52273/g.127719  ORF Transcript_52273/g.127719 Transcript_52273/m.127719 type:complete len:234 (+) Transcript_52273:382-1083(+)|eukprot:CAMPEP_0206242320 /NCGR_PEP_ID=MMETSP0047_2-20121206/16996_1 /ASSEMBLY_ACC=CAM_ASM_000192 /TAXON_ID=195065 /ORGANISM="Chroomonas mesostigmatica_cf, Strain CCMP1168" /LENGTH=233 /DNA_ID=CAMNT_0053667335 /DNA_START=379 /DNA_END=1080 /DNA_ORIENTATION=-